MLRKLPALAVAVLSLTATAEASAAGYATRTLRVGSSGSDVRAFQRYLDSAGFDTTADGAFGTATRRSVMAFERAQDHRINGVAARGEQRLAVGAAREPQLNGGAVPRRAAPAPRDAIRDGGRRRGRRAGAAGAREGL